MLVQHHVVVCCSTPRESQVGMRRGRRKLIGQEWLQELCTGSDVRNTVCGFMWRLNGQHCDNRSRFVGQQLDVEFLEKKKVVLLQARQRSKCRDENASRC